MKLTKNQVKKQVQSYGSEEAVIDAALQILRDRMSNRVKLGNPNEVRAFLMLTLEQPEHEVFWVVYLDTRHRVIAAEEAFRGTLAETSVYPREIVKRALQVNAAATIFAHNHPSGTAEPSRADQKITHALRDALALVDITVLDHFIIAGNKILSFAENDLI